MIFCTQLLGNTLIDSKQKKKKYVGSTCAWDIVIGVLAAF